MDGSGLRLTALVSVTAALVAAPRFVAKASDGATDSSAVRFWTGAQAFAGAPLLIDRTDAHQYQVYAVRRDGAGRPEMHELDTVVVLVLDGSATFITDGTITDERPVATGETTGSGIQNGFARRLDKGDIIVIPNGTPHWFSDVMPAIRYFAIQLRQHSSTPIPSSVQHWRGAEAFAAAGPVFASTDGQFHRVYALRRDKPLAVELHDTDTDLVFVVGGGGTFVTNGSIGDERRLSPIERTGSAVSGGGEHHLAAGAVIAIPSGTPHWLRDVNGTIEFFAVKLR